MAWLRQEDGHGESSSPIGEIHDLVLIGLPISEGVGQLHEGNGAGGSIFPGELGLGGVALWESGGPLRLEVGGVDEEHDRGPVDGVIDDLSDLPICLVPDPFVDDPRSAGVGEVQFTNLGEFHPDHVVVERSPRVASQFFNDPPG